MDFHITGVDPTILRSVILHKRLKKFPRVLNRPALTKPDVPLRRRQPPKPAAAARKPLRSKPLRKPEIPRELEKELQTSPFPQYCWEISAAKRKKNKAVRDELGDVNPYSHPVEGVRHNLRNMVDPVKRAVMRKELELPVDRKYNQKVKRQLKAKAIVNKIYADTKPELKFAEKPQSVPKHLETSTALEYRTTWKEIEMCKIMNKLKKEEIENIDLDMTRKEQAINSKSKLLREEAAAMEETISEKEKTLYDDLRRLVMEKDVTRCKVQKTEELADQIGLLEHQIQFILSRLEEVQKYGAFLFNMSPHEWRVEQTKFTNASLVEQYQCEWDVIDDLESLRHYVTHKIPKPVLYFRTPDEFMGILTELENVNFVMYSHSKVITNLAEAGTSYARELTRRCTLELDILREMSQELRSEILWEESHMQLLKDFCSKYIFTGFSELVYELENVKLAVESTYVDVLTTNDLNLGANVLMKEIELLVVRLTESANPSSPETIKLTKQMNYESRLRDMAQKKFEKTFREYELLLKEMRRSFEFEKALPRRRLMARSPPNLRAAEVGSAVEREEKSKDKNFVFFGDDAYPCRSK